MKVWILSTGSGEDGDAWSLIGVFSTKEKADEARRKYCRERGGYGGMPSYSDRANEPEELEVDPEIDY